MKPDELDLLFEVFNNISINRKVTMGKTFFSYANVIAPCISAVSAAVSAFFAFMAASRAKKSSADILLNELYRLYLSDKVFHSLTTAWDKYKEQLKKEQQEEQLAYKGIAINSKSAKNLVKEIENKNMDEPMRKYIDVAFQFWRQIAILVKRGLIKKELAFTSFGSPAILGFLYPLEDVWVKEYKTMNDMYKYCLKELYDLWKSERE